MKALCEQAVTARFADRALLIRPGLIVGPHDPTQRFTYWPARVARAADAEPVLVHVAVGDSVQFIDARDLAAFVLRASDDGSQGPFNLVSAPRALTMSAVLEACAAAAGTRPRWQWTNAKDVERCGLKAWSDLPLWLPADGDHAAFGLTETCAATAAGLTIRPLAQTVAETLAWYRSLPLDRQAFTKARMSSEREALALSQSGAGAGV